LLPLDSKWIDPIVKSIKNHEWKNGFFIFPPKKKNGKNHKYYDYINTTGVNIFRLPSSCRKKAKTTSQDDEQQIELYGSKIALAFPFD
jgi:hypothetical protein